VALDPNLVAAAGQLTANEVERGELVKAYQNAKGLVERHPENGFAHGAWPMFFATEECWRSLRMSATLPVARPGKLSLSSCSLTLSNWATTRGNGVSPTRRWL